VPAAFFVPGKEARMKKKRFKIDEKYRRPSLYGMSVNMTITDIADGRLFWKEEWASEDAFEDCQADMSGEIEVVTTTTLDGETIEAERVLMWEYHGEGGYLWAESFDDGSSVSDEPKDSGFDVAAGNTGSVGVLDYLNQIGFDVRKPLGIPKTPILVRYASLMAYV